VKKTREQLLNNSKKGRQINVVKAPFKFRQRITDAQGMRQIIPAVGCPIDI
jgi:hypothetical protein